MVTNLVLLHGHGLIVSVSRSTCNQVERVGKQGKLQRERDKTFTWIEEGHVLPSGLREVGRDGLRRCEVSRSESDTLKPK